MKIKNSTLGGAESRLDFIDMAKGLAMLMVIYLHVSINYPDGVNIYKGSHWDGFVHSMFMPIFFILSGLFFSAKQTFRKWVVKKAKRLVVPFIIFYLFTYLLNMVLVYFFHVQLKSGFEIGDIGVVFYKDVYSNSAIWFLLALFWSSILLYAIVRISDRMVTQIILLALCFAIGVFFSKKQINIPLYVDTAFTATPFVYVGLVAKQYHIIEKMRSLSIVSQKMISFPVMIVTFLICWFYGQSVSMVNNGTGSPLLFLVTAVAGSLSVIAFCCIIERFPIINFIGRNSLLVLCTHMYMTNLFARVMIKFDFPFLMGSILSLLLICLCYYAIVPVVRKIQVLNEMLL